MLLKANYKTRHLPVTIGKGQQIVTLERGQLLFGRFKAEESLSIPGSTIYKALQYFESEGMIKIESNSHWTVLTISKYNDFQSFDDDKVTANGLPIDNRVATNEPPLNTDKKANKGNKKKEIVYPTLFEVQEYFTKHGYKGAEKAFNHYAPKWINSKGKKVLDWEQTMRTNWFTDEAKIQEPKREITRQNQPLPYYNQDGSIAE